MGKPNNIKSKVLPLVWFIYTTLLLFGLTIIPPSLLFKIEKSTEFVSDPGSHIRHMLMFIVESFLSAAVLSELGLAFSAVLGAFTELVQYFIPWRSYDIADLLADLLGSILGFIIFSKLVSKDFEESAKT